MMSKSIPAPTKAEKRRFEKIVAIGCVACRSEHPESLQGLEVHHLLDGGVRRGHSFSVCLCKFHHRGVPPCGFNQKQASAFFGPSLALDGKGFKEKYGTDTELLAFQEFLLREYSDTV